MKATFRYEAYWMILGQLYLWRPLASIDKEVSKEPVRLVVIIQNSSQCRKLELYSWSVYNSLVDLLWLIPFWTLTAPGPFLLREGGLASLLCQSQVPLVVLFTLSPPLPFLTFLFCCRDLCSSCHRPLNCSCHQCWSCVALEVSTVGLGVILPEWAQFAQAMVQHLAGLSVPLSNCGNPIGSLDLGKDILGQGLYIHSMREPPGTTVSQATPICHSTCPPCKSNVCLQIKLHAGNLEILGDSYLFYNILSCTMACWCRNTTPFICHVF